MMLPRWIGRFWNPAAGKPSRLDPPGLAGRAAEACKGQTAGRGEVQDRRNVMVEVASWSMCTMEWLCFPDSFKIGEFEIGEEVEILGWFPLPED